jgi:NAD(P)-dependent dehydrogenase (short-subunit alcohol dehydrogenase family)
MQTIDYFGYRGKTVLVTGAGSGMGEAAAMMLADLGAQVHAVGNRKKVTVSAHKIHYADLSEKANIDELLRQLPDKFDAVFLCQGIAQAKDNHVLVQKVNFLSIRYMAEALAPRIADNGSITIISSNGGFGWQKDFETCKEVIDLKTYEEAVAWYEAHPDVLADAYRFSKRCLNAYIKCKVFDPIYISRKLRLNCICPGMTITGLTETFNRNTSSVGDPEDGKRKLEKLFFTAWDGRWAAAEEMGWPLVAIGSNLFSYMSGQVIDIDYGTMSTWEIDELQGIPSFFSQKR